MSKIVLKRNVAWEALNDCRKQLVVQTAKGFRSATLKRPSFIAFSIAKSYHSTLGFLQKCKGLNKGYIP